MDHVQYGYSIEMHAIFGIYEVVCAQRVTKLSHFLKLFSSHCVGSGHWYGAANCLDKFAWKIAFLMRIGAIRSFCMKITSLILESLHLEKEHSRYAYTRNTIWKYSPSVMSVFVWAHLFSIPLNYIQCFRKYLMLIGLIISMFSWQLRVFFPPSNLIIQDLWCANEFTTPMNHSLKITYFNYLIDKKLYFLWIKIRLIVAHEIKI